MNAIAARVREALPILASVWLYSPAGAEALIDFAIRMEMMPERALPLVQEIFRLHCEVAARRAGWCPELDAAGDDVTTDC